MARLSRWLVMIVAVLVMGILVGCGATSLATVDPALVGTWQGQCEIGLPVVFNPNQIPEGVERTKASVPFLLTISEDATVEGSVGEAILVDSVLKSNRGDLGRRLNMASDYIIMDGHLSGPIVSGADDEAQKEFTIPFNLENGRMDGSLFWRQDWKYPYPLCRVDLGR